MLISGMVLSWAGTLKHSYTSNQYNRPYTHCHI